MDEISGILNEMNNQYNTEAKVPGGQNRNDNLQ